SIANAREQSAARCTAGAGGSIRNFSSGNYAFRLIDEGKRHFRGRPAATAESRERQREPGRFKKPAAADRKRQTSVRVHSLHRLVRLFAREALPIRFRRLVFHGNLL